MGNFHMFVGFNGSDFRIYANNKISTEINKIKDMNKSECKENNSEER